MDNGVPEGKNNDPHSTKNRIKKIEFIHIKKKNAIAKVTTKWVVTVKLNGKRPDKLKTNKEIKRT